MTIPCPISCKETKNKTQELSKEYEWVVLHRKIEIQTEQPGNSWSFFSYIDVNGSDRNFEFTTHRVYSECTLCYNVFVEENITRQYIHQFVKTLKNYNF